MYFVLNSLLLSIFSLKKMKSKEEERMLNKPV